MVKTPRAPSPPNADVSTYWELRSHGAGRTAVRLDQLRELPWQQRPAQVGRWLFPSPALMRTRDQRAAEGPIGLGVAYADDCLEMGLTWRRDYITSGDARRGARTSGASSARRTQLRPSRLAR